MEKKTKLTISGTAKKSFKNIELAKTQGKNSVVIEKQPSKFPSRGGSSRPGGFKPKTTSTFNRGAPVKSSFAPKSPSITNDFERRKLAEQRATKRPKGDDNKDKKTKSMANNWIKYTENEEIRVKNLALRRDYIQSQS